MLARPTFHKGRDGLLGPGDGRGLVARVIVLRCTGLHKERIHPALAFDLDPAPGVSMWSRLDSGFDFPEEDPVIHFWEPLDLACVESLIGREAAGVLRTTRVQDKDVSAPHQK